MQLELAIQRRALRRAEAVLELEAEGDPVVAPRSTARTGANTSTASTQATYGPGSRRRARSDGRSTIASATESGKKIDVYFDANASPTQTPATDHQPSDAPERGGTSSARTTAVERQRLECEQRRVGRGEHESRRGERHDRERRAPRASRRARRRGVARSRRRRAWPPHRRGPGRTARRAASAPRRTATASAVPARMRTAIIGGWSK